jgi:hypothetical protein
MQLVARIPDCWIFSALLIAIVVAWVDVVAVPLQSAYGQSNFCIAQSGCHHIL